MTARAGVERCVAVHPAADYAFCAGAGGNTWHLAGDVDCAVADRLRDDLAAACAATPGDVHVTARSLHFIDAAGARVLVEAAQRLEPGRRLVLHGLARNPRRIFRLTGWDRTANLAIEEADDERR